MKNRVMLSLLAATLLITGCSQKEPTTEELKKQMVENTKNLPEWVTNPNEEDEFVAVGIAGFSRHGMQVMLPQAEMDGRAKLAGKIETEVSRIQEQVLRQSQISQLDDIDRAFKAATKEVVKKIPLSGAKRTKMYQSSDGTLYVLTVINRNFIVNDIEQKRNIYKQQMEQAKLTRQSIEEGMKVLDKSMQELEEATQ